MASDPIAREPTLPAAGPAGGEGDERLAAGAVAGDYVVDRHLGSGAMGDVYAGHHPVIGKRVAIKVIKPALARQSEAAARFLREARAVNHVDHPGVVDIFALGRLGDGRLFLVMDLLAGRSLRERLRAGPLAPTLAVAVLGQIAAALDAAHGKGVVHRDLKPDNVMLTGPDDAPRVHVLDFGIARLLADGADARALETLTGQGVWMGTPAYMAPEQWSADGATAASDRYALGVIAFELLTGRAPFSAASLPAMMEQHFRAAVPSVTTAGGQGRPLPATVDRVLARALAKEPGERYASGQALVEALTAALDGVGPRRPLGRGAWLAGAGAGAVMVAGALVVWSGRGRRGAVADEPAPGASGAMIEIATVPAGARVLEGGEDRGATPMRLPAVPGREVTLELVRPGYLPVRRTVTATAGEPVTVRASLILVTGFEGVWALPEGAGLRAFERRGEQVAGFSLTTADGARAFLRFFEFVPARDGVVFTATEPFVDERAPEEPSCNIPLRAEYRYEPDLDRLELRRERAQYSLVDGHCQVAATAWSEPRSLARVAGVPADAVWAESRAGAATPVVADGAGNATDDSNQRKEPVDRAPVPPVGNEPNGDDSVGKKPIGKEPAVQEPVTKEPAKKPPAKGGKAKAGGAAAQSKEPPTQSSQAGDVPDDGQGQAQAQGQVQAQANAEGQAPVRSNEPAAPQTASTPGIARAASPTVVPKQAPAKGEPEVSQQLQSPRN